MIDDRFPPSANGHKPFPSNVRESMQPLNSTPAEPTSSSPDLAEPRLDVELTEKHADGNRLVLISIDGREVVRQTAVVDTAEQRATLIDAVREQFALSEEGVAVIDQEIVQAAAEQDARLRLAAETTPTESKARRGLGANEILSLVEGMHLFHSPEKKSYALVVNGNQYEAMPLDGSAFRSHLSRLVYKQYGRTASDQTMKEAIGVLDGRALYDSAEEPVFIRYAAHGDRYYVDLAGPACPYIEIDAEGWRPCLRPPINFIRPNGMHSMPQPVPGGKFEDLRPFVNVDEQDWPLFKAYLLAAALPKGPYPVLFLQGEQGSAKTTTEKLIGNLLDPRHAGVRAESRSIQDLMIAGSNCHLLQFDNMSFISDAMSDALCRISSGCGFGVRALYKEREETLLQVQKPIAINGIEDLAMRGDLMDRSIILYLPRITEDKRRSDERFWEEFEQVRPRVLGVLFSAVSAFLRNRHTVRLEQKPRMADFVERVVAAEAALELAPGEFQAAYEANRASLHALALESSPLTDPMRKFVSTNVRFNRGEWRGTATELLGHLRFLSDADDRTVSNGWPKNACKLSGRLKRLCPHFKAIGIEIDFQKGEQRIIVLRRLPGFRPMSGMGGFDENANGGS